MIQVLACCAVVLAGCTGTAIPPLWEQADAGPGELEVPTTWDKLPTWDGGVWDAGVVAASGSGGWLPPPSGKLTSDNACAAVSASAEEVVVEEEVEVQVDVEVPAPTALYVMFDRSLSMGRSELWDPAVAAVSAFIHDDNSAGLDLALQYFPSHNRSNDAGDCTAERYTTPAVDVGRLPDHQGALSASLSKEAPEGRGTPIEGALRGLTEFCKDYQARHGEQCVAVLVTDGEPQFAPCETDHDRLTAIARGAFDDHGIQTFAVGLDGADFALLDAIATQGGAIDCDPDSERFACDVSDGPSALSSALTQIRDTVVQVETRTETQTTTRKRPLDCQWKMPEAKDDEGAIDPDRVNIELRGSTATFTLGRVQAADQCAQGGWHYDDNGSPTRILACPQTCTWLTAGTFTAVEILLGCETETLPLE